MNNDLDNKTKDLLLDIQQWIWNNDYDSTVAGSRIYERIAALLGQQDDED